MVDLLIIPTRVTAMEKIKVGDFIKKKKYTHWSSLKVERVRKGTDKHIIGIALTHADKGETLLITSKGGSYG